MSKSVQDYRNIIKILKLQLLKIRQENATLSHDLGIASESETSSYSPKINHYKDSQKPFAKNILSFLLFAHRCEIIGVTPEMIFRIADKKRDKKVKSSSFAEILKRLKLRMNDVEIEQLVALIKNENSIEYENYLQILSAFQVNSEKYPFKGGRTYTQLSLLKFGKQAYNFNDADNLYLKMNKGQDNPYLSFENYADFVKKNLHNMEDNQTVAVFMGLDLMSECQIERSVFKRQISKVFSLIERGVNVEQEMSMIRVDNTNLTSKIVKTEKEQGVRKSSTHKVKQDNEFDFDEETGAEAGAKKKSTKDRPKGGKQIKLREGNSTKVVSDLKKMDIRVNQFIQNILKQESKKQLVKSFTIFDFLEAGKASSKKFKKKQVIKLFEKLDTERNGTIDTSELIKLWIRVKETTDSDEVLFKLLYRHLREIQYPDPIAKFEVLGIDTKNKISQQIFRDVFLDLELDQEEIKKIVVSYIGEGYSIVNFCEDLKSQGKPVSSKKFKKMDQKIYKELKQVVQKINRQVNKGKEVRWRKLLRLETGQKSTANQYWDFIFTDQWTCWEKCLDIASKLDTFWRDPQFGPSKSDPSGFRSIVGNESDPPPGLPDESQMKWMTYEQLLVRRKSKQKVNFMEGTLNANQVMQGNIGDCWYVSSLSIIANKQQYIKGMSSEKCMKDPDMSLYGVNPFLFKFFLQYGMYIFKFYKAFKPVYVVVDDLFPVNTSTNQLLFAKSPNQGLQWPAFLEKAYAKLHHSYSSMISGDISQGLNDLTNSMPIKQDLQKEKVAENMEKIKRLNKQRQLMGCSISAPKGAGVQSPVTLDEEKCGLFYGHAYSIIDYLDLDTKDREHFDLIRVRNPWGHGQWILDWSDVPLDNNPQYKKLDKYQQDIIELYQQKKKEGKRLGISFPQAYTPNDDGQFLMKFDDFNNLYTNLFTGFTSETFNQRYNGLKIEQKWNAKTPSGVCKLKGAEQKDRVKFVKDNYQYILDVKQNNTDIVMYLIQEDGRLYRGQKYPYKELINPTIIFIFKLESQKELREFDGNKFAFKSLNFERRRQINSWNKFQKGKYAIVPCKMKGSSEQTDFEFRIYHQKNKDIEIKTTEGSSSFSQINSNNRPSINSSQFCSFLSLIQKYQT